MFEVRIEKNARNFIKKLDNSSQKEILKKIRKLKENPFMGKALTGNLSGLWRIRIGKYRVVYQIKNSELIVIVLDVGHRKNIY